MPGKWLLAAKTQQWRLFGNVNLWKATTIYTIAEQMAEQQVGKWYFKPMWNKLTDFDNSVWNPNSKAAKSYPFQDT